MALDLLNWGYVFLSNPEVFLVWNIIWISIKIFQGIFKTRYLWNETNNVIRIKTVHDHKGIWRLNKKLLNFF